MAHFVTNGNCVLAAAERDPIKCGERSDEFRDFRYILL